MLEQWRAAQRRMGRPHCQASSSAFLAFWSGPSHFLSQGDKFGKRPKQLFLKVNAHDINIFSPIAKCGHHMTIHLATFDVVRVNMDLTINEIGVVYVVYKISILMYFYSA